MNFLSNNLENKDFKLNLSTKVTTLNPNAAEYIPYALRSNTRGVDISRMHVLQTSGKAVLDRSESAVSSNSDDEARQYLCPQLPDDITPDFTTGMGGAELPGFGQFSLADLSIHDHFETLRSSASSLKSGAPQDRSPNIDNLNLNGKLGYSGSVSADYPSSAAFVASIPDSRVRPFRNGVRQIISGTERHHYNRDAGATFGNNLLGDQANIEDAVVNPMDILASQFPGFAAERLVDVYCSNGCDLKLTIKMLTQLELQGDGGFGQNLNSEALSVPSLSGMNFPAHPRVVDGENGLSKYTRNLQHAPNTYRYTSGIFRDTLDFASTVSGLASQDSGKYERNDFVDDSISSSRSSQLSASPYNGHGKLVYGDKSRSFGARAAPLWLTGDAVANTYLESREEAHDFAHLRDTLLEQASAAFLNGNKTLAREMSEKGRFSNLQMKAAQGSISGTVYRQRNPSLVSTSEQQGYSRGQDLTIDIHNLQVSDAMQFLKDKLNRVRSKVMSSGQWRQVRIFVGPSHNTKGSLTPAVLPLVVEQYLHEEGLQYSRPQPGLLHVMIY